MAPWRGRPVVEQLTLVDRLGRAVGEAERERMREHFVTSSRYEYLFWNQAWKLEEWPL